MGPSIEKTNSVYCMDLLQTIMEAKSNKYGEKLGDAGGLSGESPAESLISDYHDFHARLNRDFVNPEPQQPPPKPKRFGLRPKSAHFQVNL